MVAAAFLAAAGSARAETCNRQVFEQHCQACHALSKDAGQKPGPHLVDVIGRSVAGDPAFDYSPVLQAARAKGEVWTKDKLDRYLSDPQAVYAGTWMGSPPIRDAKQRADILCVLGGQ
ncbi:MAG: cytochrome c family protein [Rhodospirillales bacterium]|nr:cytochrome c family protein [Rhodospirillales bacterium]